MSKNPFVNALSAILYIIIIANLINFMSHNTKDNFLTPILVLSMFTLSAAAMAYFFFYSPFQMFFDGKKKQAIDLVFKSFAVFGAFTIIIILLDLSGLFR